MYIKKKVTTQDDSLSREWMGKKRSAEGILGEGGSFRVIREGLGGVMGSALWPEGTEGTRSADRGQEPSDHCNANNDYINKALTPGLYESLIHALLNVFSSYVHIMITILQMWWMRRRKSFAQGHMANKRCLGNLGAVLPSA